MRSSVVDGADLTISATTGPAVPSPAPEAGAEAATEPLEYLAAHIADALARDRRVNELGLHIAVRDSKVYVTGSVQTAERRLAVTEVAGELAPDHEIDNQTVVTSFTEPPQIERPS